MESQLYLFNRVSEASSRPRTERRSVKNHHDENDSDEEESRSSYSFSPTPEPVPSAPPQESNESDSYYSGPFKAMYDFESGKASRKEKIHVPFKYRAFINIFSRRATGFHMQQNFSNWTSLLEKHPFRWSNQAGKPSLQPSVCLVSSLK